MTTLNGDDLRAVQYRLPRLLWPLERAFAFRWPVYTRSQVLWRPATRGDLWKGCEIAAGIIAQRFPRRQKFADCDFLAGMAWACCIGAAEHLRDGSDFAHGQPAIGVISFRRTKRPGDPPEVVTGLHLALSARVVERGEIRVIVWEPQTNREHNMLPEEWRRIRYEDF